MSSPSFHPSPEWKWPDHVGTPPHRSSHPITCSMPGAFQDGHEGVHDRAGSVPRSGSDDRQQAPAPKPAKHWPPRTCRICLEVVHPTFHTPSESLPEILQPRPSVSYDSSDPDAGRLLRPCKCKGSSKYVHEGCLQAWRHADPEYGRRNYWQCPTCAFRYRLERMAWGRWISSAATQAVLTLSIFVIALFFMGFVADPIINLYVDPYSALASPSILKTKIEPILTDDDAVTWTEHFIKGLASLGLLGFVKVLFALSPWQWWNIRSSGIMNGGGRSGHTGRDRLANISWIVVVIGIGTFIWAVYKGVRTWSRRTLEKAGERVMDVAGDDDDDDDDDHDDVDAAQ